MILILVMCLVATAVGLKTHSYKPWEILLGTTTGLALSTTPIGSGMISALSGLGKALPGWLQ